MVEIAQSNSAEEPLAVLLLGPTASGKTAFSIALAKRFNGEILSCDSVAIYRGMDIGSAKPSLVEQSEAPHHMIDLADPDQPYTAGDYSRTARIAMQQIAGRNHLPIVTGGTGLYLRALTEGLFDGPARLPELRDRLLCSTERHGPNWLHRVLSRMDPQRAAIIHANDAPKLIRAIEVSLATRQPMSEVLSEGRNPLTGFRLLRIGLNPPRADLYQRINQRAAKMFDLGLIEETEQLLARYGRVKALDALGYRQALEYLDQKLTREEAITAAQQGHRNYAKRQMTWFRREPDVHWISSFGNSAYSECESLISSLL